MEMINTFDFDAVSGGAAPFGSGAYGVMSAAYFGSVAYDTGAAIYNADVSIHIYNATVELFGADGLGA
jgi:hypothetical protein